MTELPQRSNATPIVVGDRIFVMAEPDELHVIREAFPSNVLLLDAGDLIGDTMIADRTRGQALIEALNHLSYDAMTLGNQ